MHNGDGSTLVSLVVAGVIAAGVFYAVQTEIPMPATSTAKAPTTLAAVSPDASVTTTPTTPAPATGGPDTAQRKPKSETPAATPAPKPIAPTWAAAAPGKVEPKGGLIRLSSRKPGRIAAVLVDENDAVMAGDLLVRLDDDEARARLQAAQARVAAAQRTRDAQSSNNALVKDRRKAQDDLADGLSALSRARDAFDRALAEQRGGDGNVNAVTQAREAVKTAQTEVGKLRAALRKAEGAADIPLLTASETALEAARAQLHLAQIGLEHTRLRAPIDGTVLRLDAKVGEVAAPSPQHVLVQLGDLGALRIRAEVEERDLTRVKVGQVVSVKSKAFPDRSFKGKVASIGKALGPSRIVQRGPRQPTDVEVFTVSVDLDEGEGLLPGMRVDVFFAPLKKTENRSAGTQPPTSTN